MSTPSQNDDEQRGLRGPEHTPLESVENPARWSRRQLMLQILGLAIGLGLLIWVILLATSETNAQSIATLRQAPGRLILALLGLSAITVTINGLLFWIVLRPLARLPLGEMILINGIATFLSILPFKIGFVARTLIHHRYHRLRFRVIIPWMAAFGGLGLTILIPLVAAGLWRREIDALWMVTVLGGVVACNALAIGASRTASRVQLLHRVSLGADEIGRDMPVVAAHAVTRLTDLAVLTARFLVAGAMVGIGLDLEQMTLIVSTYFLLGIITPAGTLGPREMGVAALGFVDDGHVAEQLALVALVVSAGEILAAGMIGLFGAARIRPDRLLLRRSRPDAKSITPD